MIICENSSKLAALVNSIFDMKVVMVSENDLGDAIIKDKMLNSIIFKKVNPKVKFHFRCCRMVWAISRLVR